MNDGDDERVMKKTYDGKENGKRGRGRPRLAFNNTLYITQYKA